MSLDKSDYVSGDVLHAHLAPRFAGKAMVAIVTDKVELVKVVDLPAAGTTLDLPVAANWGAGAYLVATAFRPLDAAAKRQFWHLASAEEFRVVEMPLDDRLEDATVREAVILSAPGGGMFTASGQ